MKKLFQILVYIFASIGFVLVIVYLALQLGLTKTKGIVDNQHDYFKNQTANGGDVWQTSEEWLTLRAAIKKDVETINRVSKETGVPSRLIVAPLVVEQLRLFNSEREIFKQVFAPLKILGNQSQFSWGVMGIKQDTARQIEKYVDKADKHLLKFKATTTDAIDTERFERLTDEDDRYYSYLYGAILIKELEVQWKNAGFPLDKVKNKAAVIATLYNIGFKNSQPKANPLSGGAEIQIGDVTYSFGSLAQSFYDSKELVDVFPKD